MSTPVGFLQLTIISSTSARLVSDRYSTEKMSSPLGDVRSMNPSAFRASRKAAKLRNVTVSPD
jgi:hypothetical protein